MYQILSQSDFFTVWVSQYTMIIIQVFLNCLQAANIDKYWLSNQIHSHVTDLQWRIVNSLNQSISVDTGCKSLIKWPWPPQVLMFNLCWRLILVSISFIHFLYAGRYFHQVSTYIPRKPSLIALAVPQILTLWFNGLFKSFYLWPCTVGVLTNCLSPEAPGIFFHIPRFPVFQWCSEMIKHSVPERYWFDLVVPHSINRTYYV